MLRLRVQLALAATALGGLVVGGPVTAAPPAAPDPLATGRLPVTTIEYDAQVAVVNGEPAPPAYADRLRGAVHIPGGPPQPRPVVLVVPGRHDNCRVAGHDLGYAGLFAWPCPDLPPAVQDLPSWRGFDYLGRNLASHGYVVAVINANGVNSLGALDGTQERAQLVSATLDLLRQWHTGPRQVPDGVGNALAGRVDSSRVGLVGHSRGADGVGRFLRDEQRKEPPSRRVRALVQIAGVDIRRGNPAPTGVPMATLLGSCDADTGTLGTAMWERGRFLPAPAAPRLQWIVNGANHNWFNSEWWDEWDPPFWPVTQLYEADSRCDPRSDRNARLTGDDQRRITLALLASFLRRHVGGERAFEPYLTGALPYPKAGCPRERLRGGAPVGCRDLVRTSYVAAAGERRVLRSGSDQLSTTRGVRADTCRPASSRPCPEPGSDSVVEQVELSWDAPGSVVVPAPGDAGGYAALWLRGAVNPSKATGRTLDVVVTLRDSRGRTARQPVTRWSTALDPPGANPKYGGTRHLSNLVLNGVRIPLGAFRGVDLRDLATVELHMRGAGSMQLDEVLFQS